MRLRAPICAVDAGKSNSRSPRWHVNFRNRDHRDLICGHTLLVLIIGTVNTIGSTRGVWARWRKLQSLPVLAILTTVMMVPRALAQEHYRLEAGQWTKQQTLDPSTPQGQLQQVRKALAENRPKVAKKGATKWIKQYPNHPLLAEAYLLRGDSHVARKNYFKALFEYEHLIGRYPSSAAYHTAIEREFEIAKLFASGVRRRWILGLRLLAAGDEAEELLIRIQERSPGTRVAERASIALGDYYFDRSQMSSASEAYELFLVNYPASQYRQRSLLRLIQSNLATFKGPKFDATGLIEASQRLKSYEQAFPVAAQKLGTKALATRIEESLALKDFYTARWYERTGEQISALYMYRRLIKDWPQSVAAKAAMQRVAMLRYGARPSAEKPAEEATEPKS